MANTRGGRAKYPDGIISENQAAEKLGVSRVTLGDRRKRGLVNPDVLVDLTGQVYLGRSGITGYRVEALEDPSIPLYVPQT
jgi:hypothetical protein